MAQQKRVIRQYQEYPGSTIWRDYEVVCPDCGQWRKSSGDVDVLVHIDGKEEWHSVCADCAKEYPE